MRSLRAETEAGVYWRKLRHELAGRKTARMLSGDGKLFGDGIHPDLMEMPGRDEFQRRNSS